MIHQPSSVKSLLLLLKSKVSQSDFTGLILRGQRPKSWLAPFWWRQLRVGCTFAHRLLLTITWCRLRQLAHKSRARKCWLIGRCHVNRPGKGQRSGLSRTFPPDLIEVIRSQLITVIDLKYIWGHDSSIGSPTARFGGISNCEQCGTLGRCRFCCHRRAMASLKLKTKLVPL